ALPPSSRRMRPSSVLTRSFSASTSVSRRAVSDPPHEPRATSAHRTHPDPLTDSSTGCRPTLTRDGRRGEQQAEPAAAPDLGLQDPLAAVGSGDRAHDRQTEPAPAVEPALGGRREAGVRLVELLEHPVAVPLRDPGSVVLHGQRDPLALAA